MRGHSARDFVLYRRGKRTRRRRRRAYVGHELRGHAELFAPAHDASLAAQGEASGNGWSPSSCSPVSKMKEKSAEGGSRSGAMAAARLAALGGGGVPEAAPEAPAGRAALKKLAGIGGVGPRRPPERLSQPSTLLAKKSVRTRRFEVIPPCE